MRKLASIFLATGMCVTLSCGDGTNGTGTGGASGSGATGRGGSSGSTGSGGSAGSGGTVGSGGSGGTTGSGGSAGSGGSTGSGGSAGASGSGGSAGNAGGAGASGRGGATAGSGGGGATGAAGNAGGAGASGRGGATAGSGGGGATGAAGNGGRGGGTAGSGGGAGNGGRGGSAGAAGSGGGSAGVGGTAGPGGTGGGTAALDPCRGTALPTSSHYVPSGMCARTVATGQSSLRQIVFSSNGDMWGVNASGQIRRFRDANGDGVYQSSEIVNWATTGGNGQNVHIDEANGYLYSGTSAGVRRWMWSNTIDSGGTGQDVLTGQPTGGHGKHTVHVWDNWMYVMSGSSGNVTGSTSGYDTTRNIIKRFNMSSFSSAFSWGTSGEIYADGIRNVLGFNRDAMGRIYGVQNGQDDVEYNGSDVHNDNPGEAILRLVAGSHHGYPFCFAAQRITGVAAGTQVFSQIFQGNPRNDAWCQTATNVTPVVTFMQAHTAPMDITFFLPTLPAGALPERWRNGAFVSLHGSWNRNPATGYRVIWVPFNADGTSPLPTNSGSTTTFPSEVVLSGGSASGSTDGSWNVSGGEQNVRPVGVAVSPIDGALYISSDSQGYVYRVGLMR